MSTIERLAEKHGGVFGHGSEKVYIFGEPEIAALIADVCRDEREKCAQECESVPHGGPFAFAIRAAMAKEEV